MIIHNSSVQSYTRPVTNIGYQQQYSGKKATDLFGWLKQTQGMGRLVLAVCLVTASIQLGMGVYSSHLVASTAELEDQRHNLVDENISLRAMRASMMTPQSIERVAGEKLALQKAGEGQIFYFNSSKNRFETVQ